METQMVNTYSPDYRSPPSGLGTVTHMNNLILIQDTDCSPDVREGVYHQIYQLDSGYDEYNICVHKKLMSLLQSLNVTRVIDAELADEFDFEGESFPLSIWNDLVRQQIGI